MGSVKRIVLLQYRADTTVVRLVSVRMFVPAAAKRILRPKRSNSDHVYIVFWVVLDEKRVTFPPFFIYISRHEVIWVLIVFNYTCTSLKTSVNYTGFRTTDNLLHSWKWNSFQYVVEDAERHKTAEGIFTKYHITNKCTNCLSFILNHFFKTLFTAPTCFDSISLVIIREHI